MKQISLFRVALALTTTFIGIGSAAGQTRADSTAWDKTALRQYIDEALADEVKEQLENMPNIEIGKGLTFAPNDESFKTTIRFRMQNLAGATFDRHMSITETEAQIRRLRLRFDGYVFSPKLIYSIQLGFSGSDAKPTPNGTTNIVKDGIIYYKPNGSWSIGFGQTKLKTNRARINSSSALQFVDRSIVNSTFGGDRDFGLFGEYHRGGVDGFAFSSFASVTLGEGANWRKSSDNGLAYTGRVEFFPFGKFHAKGEYTEGDTYYENSLKLMVGAGYSFNQNACLGQGFKGSLLDGTSNIGGYYADIALKYRGFAVNADFMGRYASNPSDVNSSDAFIFTGQGANFQASYLFDKKWELAVRNSTILPDGCIKDFAGYKVWNQSTVGLTRYIIGHSLKVQLDLSYNAMKDAVSNDYDRFGVRFQIELGL